MQEEEAAKERNEEGRRVAERERPKLGKKGSGGKGGKKEVRGKGGGGGGKVQSQLKFG